MNECQHCGVTKWMQHKPGCPELAAETGLKANPLPLNPKGKYQHSQGDGRAAVTTDVGGPAMVPCPKYDAGKAQPSYVLEYFPRSILALAWVCEYGGRKYTRAGALSVENGIERYTDAHDRHRLLEYIEGQYDDGDSGLPHAAQVAWNALIRLELMLRDGVIEARRGNDIGPDKKPMLGTARPVKV